MYNIAVARWIGQGGGDMSRHSRVSTDSKTILSANVSTYNNCETVKRRKSTRTPHSKLHAVRGEGTRERSTSSLRPDFINGRTIQPNKSTKSAVIRALVYANINM